VLALFWLRVTRPSVPRPFSAWGYPVAPALFAVASLTIVANAIRESPGTSGAGLAIILAGVPLFLLTRARRGRIS
jgi:APA family basic amino acid/polyamine antiporter